MARTIRRFIAPVIIVAAVVSIPFLGARSRFANTPGGLTSKAVAISTAAADVNLAREIDRAIEESNLTQARWGVFVMSLSDGRVLCSHNGDQLFTPASNMKIYTTAVALDLLGADYRWRTSVYADKQPDQNGVIEGDLILYGRGAPDLLSFRKGSVPSLADLADQLYQRGVRRVRGNVIGDDSYFRGNAYGDGWQWTDLQWYFGAEPSALTVDANAFELTITPSAKTKTPATLEIKPNSSYLHLQNNTTTAERSAVSTIGINRGLSDNE